MNNDLELVKQLENELGIPLKPIDLRGLEVSLFAGFAADAKGRVRGLSLRACKLHRPPAMLPKFQSLEKLVLSANQISDISNLKELKGLTCLNLINNQINDISSISGLKNLKKLSLQGNKITHLPPEFLDLGPGIKWVYVGEETGVFLLGNPMASPPAEVIKKGHEAVKQFFIALKAAQQGLKRIDTTIQTAKQQPLEPPPSDKTGEDLFFISYSAKDEDFVEPLCQKLKVSGVQLWFAKWDIKPGDSWNKSIDDALEKCAKMLVILSPSSVASEEVQGEYYTFFDEKKPVFPIVYRNCKIPRRLKLIQHMALTAGDLQNKTKIEKLLKIITK